MSTIDERLEAIERRLSALEQKIVVAPGDLEPIEPEPIKVVLPTHRAIELVKVEISNKRFVPTNASQGVYESHIWFDCTFFSESLLKRTRAMKGTLELCDHFGEVKLRLQVTINEPLLPGRRLVQKAIGFTYNQFMEPHRWMQATSERDIKSSLRLSNILYEDGEVDAFQ